MKKCRICKTKFEPRFSSLQVVCEEPKCMIEYARLQHAKAWVKEKKAIKEKHMTFSNWLQLLQQTFNAYIRERDARNNYGCISCGNLAKYIQYQAGHYMGVQAFPNLRFDEENVHRQCVHCNKELYGNIHYYRIGLIERIGQERFDALEGRKNTELKISIPEIKEKIAYYKAEIKKLKQA